MPAKSVIVVSGLPRSGTSLVMQMLAAGGVPILSDPIRGADVDNPRGYYEYEPVKRLRADASWLPAAAGQAVKIIHLLLRELPLEGLTYRVLFVERDLTEVLASQRAMLARSGRKGAAIPEQQLRAVFTAQLLETKRWMAQQTRMQVLELEHRRLITRPIEEAGRIERFLGITGNSEKMAAVIARSLYRNKAGSVLSEGAPSKALGM